MEANSSTSSKVLPGRASEKAVNEHLSSTLVTQKKGFLKLIKNHFKGRAKNAEFCSIDRLIATRKAEIANCVHALIYLPGWGFKKRFQSAVTYI